MQNQNRYQVHFVLKKQKTFAEYMERMHKKDDVDKDQPPHI